MASRRGQILLAVFYSTRVLPNAACHWFHSTSWVETVPKLKRGLSHGESEGANSACSFLFDTRFPPYGLPLFQLWDFALYSLFCAKKYAVCNPKVRKPHCIRPSIKTRQQKTPALKLEQKKEAAILRWRRRKKTIKLCRRIANALPRCGAEFQEPDMENWS